MARENIKDHTGRLIAYTEQRGNRLWLHDWTGKMLGYYDLSTNKTYEWTGRYVGPGNIVMTLLR